MDSIIKKLKTKELEKFRMARRIGMRVNTVTGKLQESAKLQKN